MSTFSEADKGGQFYYVITLKDGTKIDLNGDAGGTRNNQEMNEVFEILTKLLLKWVLRKQPGPITLSFWKRAWTKSILTKSKIY